MTTTTTSMATGSDPTAWAAPGPETLAIVAILLIVALLLLISWRRRVAAKLNESTTRPTDEVAQPNHRDRDAAPSSMRVADAASVAAPVAPAPPPFESSDTPVVASAPFEAAPATLAASADDAPAAPIEPVVTAGDDLTQMKGVGPKLAARLGELGYTRYAHIAALTPTEAEALDAQLGAFRGRLTRDRWIEQASYLANGDRAGFEAAFGRL